MARREYVVLRGDGGGWVLVGRRVEFSARAACLGAARGTPSGGLFVAVPVSLWRPLRVELVLSERFVASEVPDVLGSVVPGARGVVGEDVVGG